MLIKDLTAKIDKTQKAVLRRLNNHRTTDAYVIGYPKCGNTWLQVMFGRYVQLLSGRDQDQPPLFSSFDRWGRFIRWDPRVLRVQFTHGALEWTHQVSKDLTLQNLILPYRNKRVVLLVRHIPDILVSMYWQHKTRLQPPYEYGISEFIRDPILGVDKAIAFCQVWDQGREQVKNIMLLRYEDLILDPAGTFVKFLEFLNVPIDEGKVTRAIEYASFNNMRKLEESSLKNHSLVHPSSGLPIFGTGDVNLTDNAFHVRKGQIGGYRDNLSQTDIIYLNERLRGKIANWYGYKDGIDD